MSWAPTDIWCVEHVVPQTADNTQICNYENLVLACQWCNEKKLSKCAPEPISTPYGNCLHVNDTTAEIEPLNEDGELLIRTLKLNHHKHIEERRKNFSILRNLARTNVHMWKLMMGFPKELPELAKRRPPLGNTRPEGIRDSCHERRQRGELPDWYEE